MTGLHEKSVSSKHGITYYWTNMSVGTVLVDNNLPLQIKKLSLSTVSGDTATKENLW